MSAIFVTPEWLAERLNDPTIVIVDGSWYLPNSGRDPDAEFLQGHIPGAVRFDLDTVSDRSSALPHMLPTAEQFALQAGALGITETDTIIVYDGLGLSSAPRVRWTFSVFGARDVRILEGGLPQWIAEGCIIETGPTKRQPREFTPTFDRGAVATLESVSEALRTGSATLVDARPADRFQGKVPEPRPGLRSGHMPGSISVPSGSLVTNGRLKSRDAIEQIFTHQGLVPSQLVITTCGSGVTAAIVSLALEVVGRPAKALYDGSWAEWGSSDANPVVQGAP